MEMLTCTRCKTEKPATTEFFPPHNKKRNGLDSWCRSCRATYRSGINRGVFRDVISDEHLIEIKSTTYECVICGNEEPLVVDHDHKTGKIRGLLCNHCNRGLGHFRDDPDLLEFARIYLLSATEDPEAKVYLTSVENEIPLDGVK
jgi:transcription elongation factor Elf1